jgi:hypothetical protein
MPAAGINEPSYSKAILLHPTRFALFVKGGDALPSFSRFASFHVILECKIDILLN